MKQTEDKQTEQAKEPVLPVPMRVVRWAVYSAGFACLLLPFAINYWQVICGGLILGHFASQLNAIIKK
jgi:hypothetical protein